jgi:organic radical activating enzyme
MLDLISWWNCSPKLANSRVEFEKRVNSEAIRLLSECGRADFKFVVRNREDVDDIIDTYGKYLSNERIWLMPEGSKRDIQTRRMIEVSEICIDYGFKFSPRLHVLLWNNESGR